MSIENDNSDVAALAAALVTVEARRIEAVSPNLLKHIPGPDMALWAEHAEAIIAALAAQGWRLTDSPSWTDKRVGETSADWQARQSQHIIELDPDDENNG